LARAAVHDDVSRFNRSVGFEHTFQIATTNGIAIEAE
jgi:hypothetical protein